MQIFNKCIIRKLNNNRYNIILILVISSALSCMAIVIYDQFFNPWLKFYNDKKAEAYAVAEREVLFSDRFNHLFKSSVPTDFVYAAEVSRKAVVFIKASYQNPDAAENNLLNANSGSGVIISNDGYIVTNHHVIKDGFRVEVTLNDNRVYQAKLIGADPSTDLALIKIESNNLDFLVFGNSDSLLIGEWVMAVGNPFRLQSTVTAGIVSAKGRNINLLENQGIESFIQTDAAVNPGNSGGALINTKGDLVGICTAILSNSGRYEGFSFAIPINLAKKVLADLKEFGAVQRGWLGVEIENVDNAKAMELGLKEVSGILLASVFKNGGADEAGLKTNDVILSVNNVKTSTTAEFMEQLAKFRPGDLLDIIFIRGQKVMASKATLRNQLNSTDLIASGEHEIFKKLGLELRNPDQYEKAMMASQGVMVVSIKSGSIIANTKMEPGYIITRINNKEVTSVSVLLRQLESLKGKTVILEGFYPKVKGEFPYTFEMPN